MNRTLRHRTSRNASKSPGKCHENREGDVLREEAGGALRKVALAATRADYSRSASIPTPESPVTIKNEIKVDQKKRHFHDGCSCRGYKVPYIFIWVAFCVTIRNERGQLAARRVKSTE